jgi:hypothetical protein
VLLLVLGCGDRCNTEVVGLSVGWLDGLEEMDHGCTQGQMVSEYILTLKVVSDVISSRDLLGACDWKQNDSKCVLQYLEVVYCDGVAG